MLVFDPYESYGSMEWVMFVGLASQSAFLHGKNFNIGYYTQTTQQKFFIPAMLIGTIDFYHLMPLSLTFRGGHKINAKQNIMASFSPILLIFFFFFCVRCDDRAKSSGRWLLESLPSAVVRQLTPRPWCPLQCLLAKTVGVLSPGVGRLKNVLRSLLLRATFTVGWISKT